MPASEVDRVAGIGRRTQSDVFRAGVSGIRPRVPARWDALVAAARRRLSADAWAYLAGVTVCGVAYLLLPRPGQAAVLRWTSTNVHNLHQDPVGCLITSAFFPSGSVGAWPLLIALALFGACHVLGNWRTIVVCAAGHVIGTLVSEGIVAYRVSHGALPPADRYIIDVPSRSTLSM